MIDYCCLTRNWCRALFQQLAEVETRPKTNSSTPSSMICTKTRYQNAQFNNCKVHVAFKNVNYVEQQLQIIAVHNTGH